jgi:phenylacetate-CoA ligase
MSLRQMIRFSILAQQLGQASRWNAARVEAVQARRLRKLLRHANAHSRFYRAKYRGIDLARADLSQLPPTNKEELRAAFDDVVADPRVRQADLERFVADPANLGRWYLNRYAVSHTSGSQGSPLLIVQDRRSLEILFAALSSRANPSGIPGVREGLRRLRQPMRIAIVALHRGFYPSGAAFEFLPELMGRYVQMRRLSSQQTDLASQLNDFQPHAVVAYASVLEALALQVGRLRLTELRQIGNSSEQLTERARSRIEAAFRVPILNHFGTGECLFLSDGCPTDGGAHINSDWAILEVVDDDYRPVLPGELGKRILITNLANRVQPFIRYEIGDRLQMSTSPCRCGNRLPRIERIDGRAAELFWVDDGARRQYLTGVLFHSAVDSLHEVREWQTVQLQRNHIEVRLELLPNVRLSAETAERVLSSRLAELGLPGSVSFQVKIVEKLAADAATGKFRRMISLIGPDVDCRGALMADSGV